MARDHARLLTAIWRDDDFRALSVDAQHAYMTVLSQEGLSYVGALDFFPGRLAALAAGNTEKRVDTAVKALERARFVVVDRSTCEILIRTYVRHDGVLDRRNMGKAMGRGFAKVVSAKIRTAVYDELAYCYRLTDGRQAGWPGFAELYPAEFDRVQAMASTIPLPIASGV